VELEGAWETKPDLPRGQILHDGSVSVSPREYDMDEWGFVGEVISLPYSIAELDSLHSFVADYYPDAINRTCGFHIHISTTSLLFYQALADRVFYNYLEREIEKWSVSPEVKELIPDRGDRIYLLDRIAGRSDYCRKRFNSPDVQMEMGSKSSARYTHLNFCYRLHGTLEFRLFPMFSKPNIAWYALTTYLDIIKKWLDSRGPRIYNRKRVIVRVNDAELTRDYVNIAEEV
jgi:hypothetical protein